MEDQRRIPKTKGKKDCVLKIIQKNPATSNQA